MVSSAWLAVLLLLTDPIVIQPPGGGGARSYTLDGQPGVWLPLESARRLLEAERQVDFLTKRNLLLEDLVAVRAKEIALLKDQVVNERSMQDGLRRQLETATTKLDRLEAAAAVWYRNPLLVAMTGVALGALTTFAITR